MLAPSAGEVSGPVATITLAPVGGRQGGDFLARDGDARMIFQRLGHGRGKAVPVHRQRAAGRQLVGVGGAHDQRAGAAHFFMQQADGIVLRSRRSGRNWSRPVRPGRRSGGRRCRGRAASRAAPPSSPASAACQAASEPARPPPMMCRSCRHGGGFSRSGTGRKRTAVPEPRSHFRNCSIDKHPGKPEIFDIQGCFSCDGEERVFSTAKIRITKLRWTMR